jgi:hypothetical protein
MNTLDTDRDVPAGAANFRQTTEFYWLSSMIRAKFPLHEEAVDESCSRDVSQCSRQHSSAPPRPGPTSNVAYQVTKVITVTGVVKEFRWVNPRREQRRGCRFAVSSLSLCSMSVSARAGSRKQARAGCLVASR